MDQPSSHHSRLPNYFFDRDPGEKPWLRALKLSISPDTTLPEAANMFLESLVGRHFESQGKLRKIKISTEDGYRANFRTLELFFGDSKLGDIEIDHLSTYEKMRASGIGPFIRKRRPNKNVCAEALPSGNKKINVEICLLIRLLRIAGVWTDEKRSQYRPLPTTVADLPRALTVDQQKKWLQTAAGKPRWHLVYWYSILAFATSMSTNEIRSLRLCDIDLSTGTVTIPYEGAKNNYRRRKVQIAGKGDEAFTATCWLMNRARILGSVESSHYLFPRREWSSHKGGSRASTPEYNPKRPMSPSGLKVLWDEVRNATGLKHFRIYDTRHTAITRMAESGVNLNVIMSMAGHSSRRMFEHYCHISENLKIKAMRQVNTFMNGQENAPAAQVVQPPFSDLAHRPIGSIQELVDKIAAQVKREMEEEIKRMGGCTLFGASAGASDAAVDAPVDAPVAEQREVFPPFTAPVKEISREELYELVWSEPMTRVGLRLGKSDRAVAKNCDRRDVPRPAEGHWNKLAAGKPVPPRPPLPSLRDDD